MKAVSKETIRKLDHTAIWEYKIPSIVLMENAGAGASHIILSSLHKKEVVIFCGKGNNGGDGFVIARHLHNHNVKVHVFYMGSICEIDINSDPGINAVILKKMAIPIWEIHDLDSFSQYENTFSSCEAVVDALFGTGLTREIKKPLADIIEKINSWQKKVFAIDTPSGLDCDTGEILGIAIKASATITFALPKQGFLLANGPALTGKIHVVDISIPRELIEKTVIN